MRERKCGEQKPNMTLQRTGNALALLARLEWGTFFTFSYFACEVDLTMIVVSHAKTITIRYAGGGASYYVGGRRFKVLGLLPSEWAKLPIEYDENLLETRDS
jgi:hypothetical protein